jgi:hypothetical protein
MTAFSKRLKRLAGVVGVALLLAFLVFPFNPTDAKAQIEAIEAPLGVYNVVESVEVLTQTNQTEPNLRATTTDGSTFDLFLNSLGRRGGPCPILNLEIGAINLNLLGLLVQTSDICLDITARPNEGLLGNLLCSVARLLDRGIPLAQIYEGLTPAQQTLFTQAITDLVNGALNTVLNDAVIESVTNLNGNGLVAQQNDVVCPEGTCTILDLALGPVNLNLLGLQVDLYNCEDPMGPVELVICADPFGGLLGSLLCGLLGGGQLGDIIGLTLQELINRLLELAPLQQI